MKVYSQMIGSMHNRFFHFSVSESISGRPHVACLTETIIQKKKTPTIIQQQCLFWNLHIRGSNQIFEYHFPALITKIGI